MTNRSSLMFRLVLLVSFLIPALFQAPGALAASPRTLIELVDGVAKPGLAKSWQKVKDGEYEFTLDTAAELIGGKALTVGAVKSSVESKLAATHGVTVKETAADKVLISYDVKKASEQEFLKQVSAARIRAQSTDIAADSGGSDGGIRARKPNVILSAGQIRGFVLKLTKNQEFVTFKLIESKIDTMKAEDVIDLQLPTGIVVRKNDHLVFLPEKNALGFWQPKADSLEREIER